MKKLFALILCIGIATPAFAAKSFRTADMEHESYIDTGTEKFITQTMGNANVESRITLPDDAKGFRLFPVSTAIYFSVSTSTVRTSTNSNPTSGTTVASSSFATANVALADQYETRLLPSRKDNDRVLSLVGTSNAQVVRVETF